MRALPALTGNVVKDYVRRPLFVLFALLLCAAALWLPQAGGGGTLRERLEFALYALNLPLLLVGATSVALACGVVAEEIRTERLHLVLAKPVSRAGFLASKWLGVAALGCGLQALVTAFYAAQIGVLVSAGAPAEIQEARERILVARVPVPAATREPTHAELEHARAVLEKERSGREPLPPRGDFEAQARRLLSLRRVQPGDSIRFEFAGLDPERAVRNTILIRFVLRAGSPLAPFQFDLGWRAIGGGAGASGAHSAAFDIPQYLELPAGCVSREGKLELEIQNRTEGGEEAAFLISLEEVHALFPEGGFAGNFLRVALACACELLFAAAAGTAAAALVSLPTAGLISATVYFATAASGFLRETLADAARWYGEGRLDLVVGRAFLALLPTAGAPGPLERLAEGRMYGWDEVAWTAAVEYGLRAAAVFAFAALLWSRKDLSGVRE